MKSLVLKDRTITTERPAFIMGVVNANENSFYEKSRGGLERCLSLIEDGVDILDIGSESSRPGAVYISEEEESEKIIGLVKKVRKFSDIPISIDTRKKSVFEKAYNEGADILNDISALEDDKNMASYIAQIDVPVVLMHKRGEPLTMQNNTHYENAFLEVNEYLLGRISFALDCGIKKEKIIIDPGFGFGKDFSANKMLLEKCDLLCGGEYNLLIGLSRKSFIGEMTGKDVSDRLIGTIVCNIIAVQKGASILRVHDVKECADSLNVLKYFL